MREWHVKHMEATVIKFLTGLPEGATRYQRKQNSKYGTLAMVTKGIEYDLKHGVEWHEVTSFLARVRHDPLFAEIRDNLGFYQRLDDLELRFKSRPNSHHVFRE
jgi:hypothetical protein